jgi:hypothetical protein
MLQLVFVEHDQTDGDAAQHDEEQDWEDECRLDKRLTNRSAATHSQSTLDQPYRD